MDLSRSSQKKIRKVLRSRRLSIIPYQAKVVKQEVRSEKPTNSKAIHDGSWLKFKPSKFSSIIENVNNDAKISKKEKLKAKMNVRTKPAAKEVIVQRTKSTESDERSSLVSNENDPEDDLREFPDLNHHSQRENQIDDNNEEEERQLDAVSEGGDEEHELDAVSEAGDEEDQNDAASDGDVQNVENKDDNIDTESLGDDCLADILKGFNKDIGSLYSKTNSLESDVREMKRLLKDQQTKKCSCRSLSSQFKQKSAEILIPKLPLVKPSHVRKMQSSINDNEEYESQIVSIFLFFI